MQMRVDEEHKNPFEELVRRIEDEGYSLQFVFREFDANQDELLTLLEIKNGFEALDIDITAEELSKL